MSINLNHCLPIFFSLQPTFTDNIIVGATVRYCGKTAVKKLRYERKQNVNNTCNLLLVVNWSLLI